jgi:pSer/pThr/pTyr-binding forkhead associated (FHA) protein
MAFIKIVSGDSKGTRVEIDRDEVVLGRAADNVVVLTDASVSGKHCAVIRSGRQFLLRDLGSTNGTRLNGVTITEHQLSPGDAFSAGDVEFSFDGEDVDAYLPVAQPQGEPTMKLPATDAKGQLPEAFNARSDGKRAAGIALWVIGGLVLLGALGAFIYSLFAK